MENDVKLTVEAESLEKFLANIKSKITNTAIHMIDDLANTAFDEMKSNYASAEYQEGGQSMDFVKTERASKELKTTVSMVGPQAWYSEFGTGTRGAIGSAHPLKRKFNLNPYNSGETIRTASDKVSEKTGIPPGTLYWTYKGEDGEIHYTQGIPAQKIVYNAGQTTMNKIPEITIKHVKEMFE